MADEATIEKDAVDESTVDSTLPTKDAGDASQAEGSADDVEKLRKINSDLERKLKRSEDNRQRVTELEAELAKLQGREEEYSQAAEAQRVKDEALAAANERILKAEIRAQAAGKLADPQDALRFLDMSEFEVDSDGAIDGDAIDRAISDLIKSKPYLAAQGKRFQGDADGGARKETGKPSQLTEADVQRLSAEGRHDEIVKAKAEGRLNDYLAS